MERVEQARLAKPALAKIVLRRDFGTALPHGLNNTIGGRASSKVPLFRGPNFLSRCPAGIYESVCQVAETTL